MRPEDPMLQVEEAKLDELAKLGLIQRGTGKPLGHFDPIRISGIPLSATLLAEREDRIK